MGAAIAWLFARPKLALALLLTLALACWHFQDKLSDFFDARKIARLERENAALRADVDAMKEANRRQDAAIEAATAARERNDERIPATRAATAGRVSRAPAATAADSVQLGTEAAADYAAAAGRL